MTIELHRAPWPHQRARYYHPRLSRFLSEDPIGAEGHHHNLYMFVLNDPVLLTDPLGLWDTAAVVGGVLTVGADVAIGSAVLAAAPTVATAAGAVVFVAGTVVALQFIVGGVGEIIVGGIAPPGTDLPPITPVGLATLIATRGDIRSAKVGEDTYSAGKVVTKGVRSIADLLEVIRLGVDLYRDRGTKQNVPTPPLLPADRSSGGAPALGGRK